MTAAQRWTEALAEWAIPPRIVQAAPESPWGYAPALFARRADAALATPTVSHARALEALPPGGVVLDVGCGAGAGSLPLAGRAGLLVGVDPSAEMLAAFAARAAAAGVAARTVRGVWPEAASETPVADVAVCHHVVYNVPDLAGFARALTGHAARRVVLELTVEHPQAVLNDLWLRFHGLARPARPTVDDAVAVLREKGLAVERTDWLAPPLGGGEDPAALVASTRRRLCLPAQRDAEIAAALAARAPEQGRRVATLWWAGGAAPAGL